MRQETDMQRYRNAVRDLIAAVEAASRAHRKVEQIYRELGPEERPLQAVSCWSTGQLIADPRSLVDWKYSLAALGFADVLPPNDPGRLEFERQLDIERSREAFIFLC
jgi:hypothetical protein